MIVHRLNHDVWDSRIDMIVIAVHPVILEIPVQQLNGAIINMFAGKWGIA